MYSGATDAMVVEIANEEFAQIRDILNLRHGHIVRYKLHEMQARLTDLPFEVRAYRAVCGYVHFLSGAKIPTRHIIYHTMDYGRT